MSKESIPSAGLVAIWLTVWLLAGCLHAPAVQSPIPSPMPQSLMAQVLAIEVATAGTMRLLESDEMLQSGDRFAVRLRLHKPASLYVMHLHAGQVHLLAESSAETAQAQFRMPAALGWLQVPTLVDGDRVCVVVSSTRIGALPPFCRDEDDPEFPRGPPKSPPPPPRQPPPTKGNVERRNPPAQRLPLPTP